LPASARCGWRKTFNPRSHRNLRRLLLLQSLNSLVGTCCLRRRQRSSRCHRRCRWSSVQALPCALSLRFFLGLELQPVAHPNTPCLPEAERRSARTSNTGGCRPRSRSLDTSELPCWSCVFPCGPARRAASVSLPQLLNERCGPGRGWGSPGYLPTAPYGSRLETGCLFCVVFMAGSVHRSVDGKTGSHLSPGSTTPLNVLSPRA
jgi:hypothetical protein